MLNMGLLVCCSLPYTAAGYLGEDRLFCRVWQFQRVVAYGGLLLFLQERNDEEDLQG